MKITYFNWHEIKLRARRDKAAILILTFAQTPLYNVRTTKGLMRVLKINHIPIHLFTSGILEQKTEKLVCHYKTREPMSYINNPYFLTHNMSVNVKIEYIQLLALRRISEKINYIPTKYVSKHIVNPYIKIKGDKMCLPQELSVSKAPYI
jgi:hypothetical protein